MASLPNIPIIIKMFIVIFLIMINNFIFGKIDFFLGTQYASKSIIRFILSYLALFWLSLQVFFINYIFTGEFFFIPIITGLVTSFIFSITIEILWSFIAPDRIPTINQLSEQLSSITSNETSENILSSNNIVTKKSPALIKTINRGWSALQEYFHNMEKPEYISQYSVLWVLFTSIFLICSLALSNSYEIAIKSTMIRIYSIYYIVLILLQNFIFITYYMANKRISDETRLILLVKVSRDTFPGFVLAASLFWMVKVSWTPPTTWLSPFAWSLGGLLFLGLLICLIPLQYQKGVSDSRKFREIILIDSISMLDRIISQSKQMQDKHRIELFKFNIDQAISEIKSNMIFIGSPRDYFSVKNIYQKNPDSINIDLLHHIEKCQLVDDITHSKWEDYLIWLRQTVDSELGILHSAQPKISEWIISILAIFFSTILTKVTENILAYLTH